MADALQPRHDMSAWARSPTRSRTPGPILGTWAAGWDLLLVCVALHIANYVGRVPQLFPVLSALKIAWVVKVCALALYLLYRAGPRHLGQLRSSTTTCLLGLLLWSAFSVPAALYPGLAFHAWMDFAWTVVMCLVIAGTVRNRRDVERLIMVYFGVTVLYVAVVLSRFQLSADNWRLGDLYFYDANDLATLIVSAMPFGLYAVLGQRRRAWVRLLAALGLAVLAVGLTRTGSRGGFLAFLAVVAFILLAFTTIPKRSRLVGLVVVLTIVSVTASDHYWKQMQTILNPRQDYNANSEAGRLKVWERGLGYMANRPMFGVGISNFQVAEGTISPHARRRERGFSVYWTAAHNTFIQAGAELGVPGLVLFVGLFSTAFASLRRVARRARSGGAPFAGLSRLAQTLLASMVGFTVGAFFLSLAYTDMLATLAALTIALHKVARIEVQTGLGPSVSS